MAEEYSNSSDDQKQSRYNSGLAILYRMDDLWKDTHRHAREINYPKWNEDLDRQWMELYADSKKEDKDQMLIINNKLIENGLYSNLSLLRRKKPILFAKLMHTQKRLLMEKEGILRELQNKQGKGSAYEDDIEDYMD